MSAVAEIEAAIARLVDLRDGSTSGPWVLSEYSGIVQSFEIAIPDGSHRWRREGVVAPENIREHDSALIVALHGTINAQLEVLRIGKPHGFPNGFSPIFEPALTLARAINNTA